MALALDLLELALDYTERDHFELAGLIACSYHNYMLGSGKTLALWFIKSFLNKSDVFKGIKLKELECNTG